MSAQSRAILKAWFETNDRPTQAQFAHLIDSFWNLTDDGFLLGNTMDITGTTAIPAQVTTIFADCTSGSMTVSLTQAAGAEYTIVKTDPGINTVSFAAVTGSIVGGATVLAVQGNAVTYVSNGVNLYMKSVNF